MDTFMFVVAVRDFMSKAVEYASEASKISTSISLSQAQAEQLALRILSSCTRRDTPPLGSEMPGPSASSFPSPMVSQGILPYDDSEGLNEEEARLAAGRVMIVAGRQPDGTGSNNVEGQSDTVSLGTGTIASDVANLLDLSQEPMDMLWAGELVYVPDGNKSQHSQTPEEDIIILDPRSRTPRGVSLETGEPRASQGTRGRIRSVTAPASQTASAASLMMPPPSTSVTYGSLDFRRGVPLRPPSRGRCNVYLEC